MTKLWLYIKNHVINIDWEPRWNLEHNKTSDIDSLPRIKGNKNEDDIIIVDGLLLIYTHIWDIILCAYCNNLSNAKLTFMFALAFVMTLNTTGVHTLRHFMCTLDNTLQTQNRGVAGLLRVFMFLC